MFKPTDEQMEEWFKPAWEEVNLIMDELNAETKCGLEYMIYMMEQMTESLKSTKKIMDAEGTEN